jgi:regulatory protein
LPWKRSRAPAERSADAAAARAKALELLAGRDFACEELYGRLCRAFTDEASAAVIAELAQAGYLDDARCAAVRARSLLAQHRSRRAIAEALRRRGIDRDTAAAALAALYGDDADAPPENGPDPELQAAVSLVERQYRRRLAEGRADLVLAALARRGFSGRTARAALDLVQNGAPPED